MARRSAEPVLWILFSAGGVLSALLLPAIAFLFALAFPLGWLASPEHAYMLAVLRHPLTRLVLFIVCVLSVFHWAHRFRYTLYDGLQIKHLNELVTLFCYGGAIAGSVWAAWVLWRLA